MSLVKKCSKCKVEKVLEEFYTSGKHIKSWCKVCELAYAKSKWPDISNKPGYKESKKAYFLQHKYGKTVEEIEDMFVAQGSKCAICPATEPGGKGQWHIDHNHATKEVRGVLCQACNLMLGQAKDNPAVLREAANYLDKRVAMAAKV